MDASVLGRSDRVVDAPREIEPAREASRMFPKNTGAAETDRVPLLRRVAPSRATDPASSRAECEPRRNNMGGGRAPRGGVQNLDGAVTDRGSDSLPSTLVRVLAWIA